MRRRGLLLAAGTGGALAGGALLGAGRAEAAPGYGPLRLGMRRDDALRALGPGAKAAPLCGGAEGVLFDHRDAALTPVPGRPVPAMAMFADGAVSEIEAALSDAAGGRDEGSWRALVAAQLAEVERRAGARGVPAGPGGADALGASAAWRLDRPGRALHLSARWMRRSGACFTRLHWLAAGAAPVIPPG